MGATEASPVLADAADVLSDQLHRHLHRLAALLQPHALPLEKRFLARLRQLGYSQRQRVALAAITPGAAALMFAEGRSAGEFFEQIEYNGRRLAKLNLPPSLVVSALQQYDQLLAPSLGPMEPAEHSNFQWVREQLNFCVILTLNNAYYQVREAETQAFYDLSRVELESRNLGELLQGFLQTLVRVCHASAGNLFWLEESTGAWHCRAAAGPDGLLPGGCHPVPATASQRKALASGCYFLPGRAAASRLLDPAWEGRYQSFWSVPLQAGTRTAGVLQFAFAKPYEWLPREQELLAAAAERCLMAADKARLVEDLANREEQIRQLAGHMLHVEEMERRRISRELHDEAGQSLLCIRLQLEMIEQALPDEMDELRRKLETARTGTEHTIVEIRRLIAALSPAVLEQLGLGAALRQLVTRFRRVHPCRVRLQLSRLGALPQKTETIVYRLVQECCNNIGKHSQATQVNISVASADKTLKLAVEDNGVGFRVEEALAKRDSFGLSGIRERVALLGGHFRVTSRPADVPRTGSRGGKHGTEIYIELPIPADTRPESWEDPSDARHQSWMGGQRAARTSRKGMAQ